MSAGDDVLAKLVKVALLAKQNMIVLVQDIDQRAGPSTGGS
jgi:hypothetical protein